MGPAPTWLRLLWTALLGLLLLGLPQVSLAAPPAPAPAPTPAPTGEIPPSPDRWVTDRAGVLSPATEQQLDRRLQAYEQQTGHQVIVWIGQSTGAVPIERFAVEAFERWKIGRAKLDDGLAVFVMVEDRAIRIEVGYGLEPTVTDLIAARVIREIMIPNIQAGDWDQAITAGVEALLGTIEGRPDALAPAPTAGTGAPEGAPEARGPPPPPWLRTAKIIGIVILVVGFIILLIVNPRLALWLLFLSGRGGGGGGGFGGGGGGFGGGGGRSGGGGSTGRW